MKLPEHILDICLQRLRAGESVFDISASYPEYQNEIEETLSLVSELSSISTLSAPTPQRKHKYAAKAFFLADLLPQLTFSLRLAVVPLSFVMIFIGGKFMMNATANSLPGDRLYAVKRATEEARLNLTQDQDKIAMIHLELTQKRIEELKQAINSDNHENSAAAVEALKTQAQKTFDTVPLIAENKALNEKDSSLVQNLVAINNEQKNLLAEINKPENNDIAMSVLSITQSADESIAKLLAKVSEPNTEDKTAGTATTGTASHTTATDTTIETTETPNPEVAKPAQQADEPMASVIAEPIEPQFEKP